MKTEALLLAWDPLGYGPGSYGPEYDDIAMALTHIDSIEELSDKIRQILMDSFEECPPEDETRAMAQQLLVSSESCQL